MPVPRDPEPERPPETLTLGPGTAAAGSPPPQATRNLPAAAAPGTLTLGPAAAAAAQALGPAAGAATGVAWRPGDVIDGLYEIEELLGEGGFGTVHKVYHRLWRMELAVKAPRPDRVANRRALELFVQEANTWVGLGLHPHITACFAVRLMGVPRIFIEYMGGGTLSDWLSRDQVRDQKAALDFAVQIARGMDYAHSKGLVHRDLKPGNCLMTPGGGLKITDFGLAKVAGMDESDLPGGPEPGAKIARVKEATQTGRLGTPEYMAPEQWTNPREAGPAADAWAFGAILYELCCGKKPFAMDEGEPVDAFYARLLQSSFRYEKPRGLPEGLAELIAGCLSEDPAKRPSDFKALASALEAVYEKAAGAKYGREAARPTLLADTLNNQGVSLADLGRGEEALRLFEEALRLDPTHPGATYNRGMLLADSGEAGAAEPRGGAADLAARLAQAKKARPRDWSGPYLLGLAHLRRKDAAAAAREFEEAQALSHHHENPLVAQAKRRAESGAFAGPPGPESGPPELFVALPTGSEGAAMGESAFKRLLRRAEKELAEGRVAEAQETLLKARQVKGYERAAEAMELSRQLAGKGTRRALRGAWQKRVFEGSEGALSAAISADGFLWTGHEGNVLKRWDPATGALLETGKGGGAPALRSQTPDKRFALEAAGKTLRVSEQAGGTRPAELDFDGEIAAVALSPDGCVAYAAGKAGVRSWELDWEYDFEPAPEPQPALPDRRFKPSRRNRILALAVLAAGAATWWVMEVKWKNESIREHDALRFQEQQAARLAVSVRDHVAAHSETLSAAARHADVVADPAGQMNVAKQYEHMNRILQLHAAILELSVIDLTGQETLRIGRFLEPSPSMRNLSEETPVKVALRQGRFMGKLERFQGLYPMLTIAVTIADPRAPRPKPTGVLLGKISLNGLSHMLSREFPEGGRFDAAVVAANGFLVAHSNPKKVFTAEAKLPKEITDVILTQISGKGGGEIRLSTGKTVLDAFATAPQLGWVLYVQQDLATARAVPLPLPSPPPAERSSAVAPPSPSPQPNRDLCQAAELWANPDPAALSAASAETKKKYDEQVASYGDVKIYGWRKVAERGRAVEDELVRVGGTERELMGRMRLLRCAMDCKDESVNSECVGWRVMPCGGAPPCNACYGGACDSGSLDMEKARRCTALQNRMTELEISLGAIKAAKPPNCAPGKRE